MKEFFTRKVKTEQAIAVFLAFAAFAAGCFQFAVAAKNTISLTKRKVWVNRHLDAISRGADAAYGEEFKDFISFLRSEIPDDATVVLLRTTDLTPYRSKWFMQYFLFPRKITICEERGVESCVVMRKGPGVYFLDAGGFNPTAQTIDGLTALHFNESLRIYNPVP